MKLAIVVVVFMAIAAVSADDKYTTKYDNIDLDEILKSDRLFNNYYKCLMENVKCTPDGRELRQTLPDALQTECKKCSEKQRENTDKVLRFIIEKKPEEWKALQKKFDPENIYYNKYKDEATARGIKI